MKMKETYTEWLEERSSDMAFEIGTLRGLLDIALIAMEASSDPVIQSEHKYLKEKFEGMTK